MKKLVLIFAIMFSVSSAFAVMGGHLKSASMEDAYQLAQSLQQQFSSQNVLIVFDADNTLLAMNQSFGSDQWFNWQSALMQTPNHPDLISTDFNQLLQVQGWLFSLSQMHSPENITPSLVSQLQAQGFPMIILTSRGPEYRNALEKELSRNGYDFTPTCLPVPGSYFSRYLPYDLSEPEKYGLSQQDLSLIGNKPASKVSYLDGIFMTAGQHKGVMLKTLLHKAQASFQAILFVDDTEKHSQRIQAAFKDNATQVFTIHYTHEDPAVEQFNASSKQDAISGWQALNSLLNLHFL